MPKTYDPEFKARAVRLVCDHLADYGSVTAASLAVGAQLGVARETLRRWVAQAEIDDGARPGVTSAEAEEVRRLKAENKRLREANEILKAASISSRENSTPATADHGLHRAAASPWLRGRVGLPGPARAGRAGRREDLPGLEAARPPARGPHHHRRRRHRRPARCAQDRRWSADARKPVRAPQDDRAAWPPRPASRALHGRPAHAPARHAGRAPRQDPADHDPGHRRDARRRPAGARLHRASTQPSLD